MKFSVKFIPHYFGIPAINTKPVKETLGLG